MSDISFDVKLEDNSELVKQAEAEAIERALYAMGVNAVEGSVDAISGKYNVAPAVDTGRLRASISFITAGGEKGDSGAATPPNGKAEDKLSGSAEKNSVVVGSNVEYAEYVHDGTSRMEGRPFLREGIDQTKEKMQAQVEKILKGEL